MKWPRIIRPAYQDARDAVEKLDADNRAMSSSFTEALSRAFDQIAAHPRQHGRLETNRTDQEVRRVVLQRFKYLVIYKMAGDQPVVVAVMHASQQPDYWQSRLDEA